jgi:pyruvate ferredoxin oxidoreductase alpha subunit
VLNEAYTPIVETLGEFGKHFKRNYKPIETYKTEDAEVLLLTMGSISETAMSAIDRRRENGQKVGLVHIRLWRPFPFADLRRAIEACPVLGVVDRHVSSGGPIGPVASEVKAACYPSDHRPKIVEFVAGLGGRDLPFSAFDQMFDALVNTKKTGVIPQPAFIGLRE